MAGQLVHGPHVSQASKASPAFPRDPLRENSRLRRDGGGRGTADFRARCPWLHDGAGLVQDECADGGQGGPGLPVVVAAQQQIHRMPAPGGRDEDPDHRSGRAAAAALSKTRRPGPAAWSSAARPAVLVLRRGNLILIQSASGYGRPLNRDLIPRPAGTFDLNNPRRAPVPRATSWRPRPRREPASASPRIIAARSRRFSPSGPGVPRPLTRPANGNLPVHASVDDLCKARTSLCTDPGKLGRKPPRTHRNGALHLRKHYPQAVHIEKLEMSTRHAGVITGIY